MQIPIKLTANLQKASLIYIKDGISLDRNFLLLRCLLQISNEEACLETQGQSVGSGEKAGRKLSSAGERAPRYRLSPNYFPKFKRMLAPDWAQRMLCIIVPNRRTHLLSSFRVFADHGYCLDDGLSGSCTKEMHAENSMHPQSFMHSKCDFLSKILIVYFIQKAQEKKIARSCMLLW